MIRKQTGKKKIDPMKLRRLLIMATIVLVAALTAVNIWMAKTVKIEAAKAQASGSSDYGKAAIGGEVSGLNQRGKPFTLSETNGKLRLVFFGFTHCPDICPTTLSTLTDVQNTLGDASEMVVPVFVTVDPKRDTPEVMNAYLTSFHPSVIGVSGTKEQVEQATSAFKVFHSSSEIDEYGEYIVDHSGYVYLMDTNGNYLAHFAYGDPAEKIVDTVKRHL